MRRNYRRELRLDGTLSLWVGDGRLLIRVILNVRPMFFKLKRRRCGGGGVLLRWNFTRKKSAIKVGHSRYGEVFNFMGKRVRESQSLVLGNETGTEENETRGRWNRDKELEIEGNIDELRLDGYSDADIQKKLPYSKELIVTKRELLEKRDKLVGEETDQAAKKRELDLQYLKLIKTVKETIESLSVEETRLKIEGQKLIREIISDRAKLWSVDGKPGASTQIRMNNVENVVLGGTLSKKQLNVIGDISSGKVSPEEIKSENAVIECERLGS